MFYVADEPRRTADPAITRSVALQMPASLWLPRIPTKSLSAQRRTRRSHHRREGHPDSATGTNLSRDRLSPQQQLSRCSRCCDSTETELVRAMLTAPHRPDGSCMTLLSHMRIVLLSLKGSTDPPAGGASNHRLHFVTYMRVHENHSRDDSKQRVYDPDRRYRALYRSGIGSQPRVDGCSSRPDAGPHKTAWRSDLWMKSTGVA